jgi:hypothetical protein
MSLGQLQEPLELMTLGPDVVTEFNRNHSGGSSGSSTWWRVMHGAVSHEPNQRVSKSMKQPSGAAVLCHAEHEWDTESNVLPTWGHFKFQILEASHWCAPEVGTHTHHPVAGWNHKVCACNAPAENAGHKRGAMNDRS